MFNHKPKSADQVVSYSRTVILMNYCCEIASKDGCIAFQCRL